MASLIRSVGGLSKCFYQSLSLVDLNADVIGQSINKRGVAWEIPCRVTDSSSFPTRFLYGFPYRFQRAWTVLWSMKHPLDVVRVGAWNSLDVIGFESNLLHSTTKLWVRPWERHWSNYPSYNMWGCVFSVYPFPLWWLRDICFVLLSLSNQKYELLPIV